MDPRLVPVDEDKPGNDEFHSDGLFLDVDGQLGIEYNFEIPIQISLDMRPEFGLINDDFDFGYGFRILKLNLHFQLINA